MRRDLPSGTVTFLFTDIEGSTKLLHEVGAEAYGVALAEHHRRLRDAFARHNGIEIGTEGDAFFYVFPDAAGALEAARDGQDALSAGSIRVRMGVHTGTAHLTQEGYVGEDIHKAARIAAAGHGGQVLVSRETKDLAGTELMDLGEHRLKDFGEPVWIFQLGRERFPPLKTISNTNLPRPASSFVGRAQELEHVVSFIRQGARLVTLTGPGGSGKTRLALAAAAELIPEYRNGVFWIGLAPLRDPALVIDTVARTLGAKDGLADHIGEREMLLLLDNFEQVVEAAPELPTLLAACPNLRILVTSRELLRVQGEVEYSVPPLAQGEAVELFCTRSGLEANEAIARLCRHLDDLPLAVELAAARTKVLSPAQILDRLSRRLDLLKGGRDADPRQATLRTTIAWSHDLLSDPEKELFARLSVFAGGCDLRAAERVAGADLDTLQGLVDKSLVRRSDARFWMLETIREYAGEHLAASGESDDLSRQHAEYFLALAEDAEPHLRAASRTWFELIEQEHPNLRAALDRYESSPETQLSLRLAGALSEFWDERGYLSEGRHRLDDVLNRDPAPTAARAKALNGAAALAVSSGAPETARQRAEEGLALYRELGDERGIAESALQLGAALGNQGDFARAVLILRESLERFSALGDENATLVASRYLAWAYHETGDREAERTLLTDNLARARALGNERMEASTLGALAMLAVDEGDVADALRMLERCHGIHRDRGETVQVALNLGRFARALAAAGQAERATRVLASSDSTRAELGAQVSWIVRLHEETLAIIRSQLDESAFDDAWNEGRGLSPDQAVALALGVSA